METDQFCTTDTRSLAMVSTSSRSSSSWKLLTWTRGSSNRRDSLTIRCNAMQNNHTEPFQIHRTQDTGQGAHANGSDGIPYNWIALQSLQVLPARPPADGLLLGSAVTWPTPIGLLHQMQEKVDCTYGLLQYLVECSKTTNSVRTVLLRLKGSSKRLIDRSNRSRIFSKAKDRGWIFVTIVTGVSICKPSDAARNPRFTPSSEYHSSACAVSISLTPCTRTADRTISAVLAPKPAVPRPIGASSNSTWSLISMELFTTAMINKKINDAYCCISIINNICS